MASHTTPRNSRKRLLTMLAIPLLVLSLASASRADVPPATTNLVAGVDEGGRILVMDSNGNGTFSNYRQLPQVLPANTRGLTVGDFDEDGKQDIVMGYYSSTAPAALHYVFLKNVDGATFASAVEVGSIKRGGTWNEDMTTGDFNNDGHLDFIGGGDSSMVLLYVGRGDGTFSVGSYIPTASAGRGVDAGDFNEDGNLDFVRATYSDGYAYLYLGDGTGNFAPGRYLADAGSDPYGVAAGDFDNDGHLDLIIDTGSGGDATFYKGDGRGNFAAGVKQVSLDINSLGSYDAFDFNNDCKLDIVVSTNSAKSFSYYPGNGNGTFGAAVQLNKDANGTVVPTTSNVLAVAAPPLTPMACRPSAALSVPGGPTVSKGAEVTFNSSASLPGTDQTIANYAWDFGDGTAVVEGAEASAPVHVFSDEGRYSVRLTVTNSGGYKDSADLTLVVTGPGTPVANAGGPYAFTENGARFGKWWGTLSGAGSSDPDGLVSYAWDFGGSFIENFDGEAVSGWAGGEGTWALDTVNKTYNQTNATISRSRNLFSAPLPDDYTVEVDVTTLSGSGNEVQLLFDAVDIRNNFELILRGKATNDHDILLYRRVNDATSSLAEVDYPVDIAINTPYHLKVEVRGTSLKAYVNNDLIISQTVRRFPYGGKAGLSTYQTVARFDNLQVVSLPRVTSTPGGYHLYRATGDYSASLTVTDKAGQQATSQAAITVSKGDTLPTAQAGGPYSLSEVEATAGAWQLFTSPSGASPAGGIYQYNWNFGDTFSMSTYASPLSDAHAAVGQVHYGYDVPGARLLFLGLQDGTTCQIVNLVTGQVTASVNLSRYGTVWHDGPGDNIPFKVISNKPVLINETNNAKHTTFIPSLTGGAVGHEFTFYYHQSYMGSYYLYAFEDTALEISDNSYGYPAYAYTLAAGSSMPISLDDGRIYTIRSTGKVAVQTVAFNSFSAVPSSTGDGAGRLFFAATDGTTGGGVMAAFAHEDAQVNVYDLDSGAKLHGPIAIAAGAKWYQEGIGTRRLKVESSGDIELWAGDKEGSGIDNMGDDQSFIAGKGLKDYYFRALADGAVLFAPYDDTSVTINGVTSTLNHDAYQLLSVKTDYHVTASKPVFIQILGKANAWNDFGGYLAGILRPRHAYIPGVSALPKEYAITVTATDHLQQVSTPAATTTATLTPGQPPVARAGDDQSAGEVQGVGGVWTFTFNGSGSSDDHAVIQYAWDFGDGGTATGPTPSHTYVSIGTYTVTLTVSDEALQTHSDTMQVSITPSQPPVANAGQAVTLAETAAVNGGFTFALDGTGSTDDNAILRYVWELDAETFDGFWLNPWKWQTSQYSSSSGLILQDEVLTATGKSAWGNTYVYSVANSQRAAGMFMQAKVKQTSGGNAMIGFKNIGTGLSYSSMPHAIYFNAGTIRIYEDGASRTLPATVTYSADTWYDVKIELKAPSGARYYIRPSSGGAWQLIYNSDYGSNTDMKQGFDVHAGTFTVDDWKRIVTGAQPTVLLYGPTDITLTVEDNAHQTASATIPFAVSQTMQPPVAKVGGPYFTRDGLPTVLNGAASTGERQIVAYKWQTGSGQVYYGQKIKPAFSATGVAYPVSATASSQYSTAANSANQATGPPNVQTCVDHDSAWTTTSQNMGAQWLELDYGRKVTASAVRVHETYSPGFVTKVDFFDDEGQAITVWQGTDTTGCPGWLHIPLATPLATQKVRVYVDTNIAGWNEIDTVGLVTTPTNSDSLTLTVIDSLGVTDTETTTLTIEAAPTVVAVPWQFHSGLEVPHDTYTGKAVLLKAVAYDSSPSTLTYSWDFGDGSPKVTGTASSPRAIETTHTYSGGEGTLFTATITVTDGEGFTHSDSYPVVIRALNMDTEINIAIDDGLWWLHKNQYRTADFYFGRWASYSSYYSSATASALQAFEINGHLEGGKFTDDPYSETVWDGLDFLLRGGMSAVAIAPHTLGNPDSNGNGIGIQAPEGDGPYQTGMLIDALVASQTPSELARVGPFTGRPYRDIAQDMIDMYASGIYTGSKTFTSSDGISRTGPIGGWRYSWGNSSVPDNSACQWAAIGLIPAEKNWGLTIPAFVKEANDTWLWYSFSGDKFGYTDTGNGNASSMATRPSGMVQMVMNGNHDNDPPDPRWTATEGFFASSGNWTWFVGNNSYYAWYAFTKAMRLANIGETLSNGFNWFRGNDAAASTYGIARTLLAKQETSGANRGRWIDGGQVTHPGSYGNVFVGSWSVIMLTPTLFELPPVANAGGNRVWGDGLALTFDASASRHMDASKRIVLYQWDFDGDGVYDSTGVSPKATHTYTVGNDFLPKTFNVTLRVTDNGDSLTPPVDPLQDTDTITVQIVAPPHDPVAVPGGPYQATVGVPLTLDGSRSYDIDSVGGDYITQFAWDLDGDWDFDAASGADVVGDRQAAGVLAWTFNAPGIYNIALRVADNGLWNDLNANGQVDANEKKTHTTYTTVQVTSNEPPVAVLPAFYSTPEGSDVTLDGGNSSDPNGTAIGAFAWDLDNDGQFDDASGPQVTHRWQQNGTYPIALRVTDIGDSSKTGTAHSEVRVANVNPQVNAGPDVLLFGSLSVALHGQYFDPAAALDTPYTVLWDFGDGKTAADTLNPTHVYDAAGTYTVTLTVTDKDGGAGSDTLTARQVINPQPVVIGASNGEVILGWNDYQAPAGLHHYAIYQGLSTFSEVASMTPVQEVNGTLRQALVTGLTNDTEYFFAVVSVNQAGAFNPLVTPVLAKPTLVDRTPPMPVSGLRATMLPGNAVQLAWSPSISEDTTKYLIYGDNGSGTVDWTTPIAEVTGQATATWTSGALSAGQTYAFGVRAQDGASPEPNTEQNSNTVSIQIAYADLKISLTSGTATVNYNEAAPFVLKLENLGTIATPATFSLGGYADAQFQQSFPVTQAIAPGGQLSLPVNWQVTMKSQTANYAVTWKADWDNQVTESDETNNVTTAWQLKVNQVHFLSTAASPDFVKAGDPIALSAVATNSDDLAVVLNDQAVKVVVNLKAEGVNVAGPFDLAWDGTAQKFTYSLNTAPYDGPFTVLFKLYNANKTALLKTAEQEIIIGASDYYVSVQSGSDSQGIGTQASPWQSISHALAQIRSPKATLHVAPGLYAALETFPLVMKAGISLAGSFETPAEILGRADSAVIVFPSGVSFDNNTTLEHLAIRGGAIGLHLQAGQGGAAPILRHLTVRSNAVGIRCEGTGPCSPALTHVSILNNTATGLELLGLGNERAATSAPVITASEVRANGLGVLINVGDGQNNAVLLLPTLISTTISANSGHGLLARNAGGWNSHPEVALRCDNLLVVNNGGDGISLDGSGGLLAAAITNATISANGTGIRAVTASPAISNTVVWGNSVAALAGVDPGQVSTSDIEDERFDGTGSNMAQPPQFTGPAAGNFAPLSSSPLVDSGTDSNAPLTDLRGLPRPKNGDSDPAARTDIGAYELQFYASAGPDQAIMVHKPLTFSGSVAGGVEPYGVQWEFGDGQGGAILSPSHAYGVPGLVTALLRVTDSSQNVVADTMQVTVKRPVLGDVNGDDAVDLKDAIVVLRVISNQPPQDWVMKEADTNNDGRIDLGDLIFILRRLGNTTPN